MDEIIKNLTGIGLIANLIGMMFLVYKHFRGPDIKASSRLDKIETACPVKHSRIDEIFKDIRDAMTGINTTFADFRKNDYKHIEENTRIVSDRMARMEGQMDTIITLMKEVLNKR